MKVEYIAQPNSQLGKILFELLDASPKRVIFVSAFVGLQTIIRLKDKVLSLNKEGSDVRFVLGIDLGGTSQEVLEELLGWGIDVRIIKHRIPGHTFHPKLYLFQWENKGEIIIGSNNITEGGFFGNYEGYARINYELPTESAQFEVACAELERFINPDGPTVYALTEEFLKELISRNAVPPTEAVARIGRDVSRSPKGLGVETVDEKTPLFGIEDIEPPPPLPAEVLERLVKNVRDRRRRDKISATMDMQPSLIPQPPIDDQLGDALFPAAFYMTLPTIQGDNIPGEARIPLEAIELAKEFWGWRDEYTIDVSPRAGRERVYWNWRPKWRVWSVENPDNVITQEVRMYMYENSSDFRFYVRPLVNAGGDRGDVVRIRRLAQPDCEYECVLARQGTPQYNDWLRYCTQPVRNSTRLFGYA